MKCRSKYGIFYIQFRNNTFNYLHEKSITFYINLPFQHSVKKPDDARPEK